MSITCTGSGVTLFRWLAMRGAVKLEAQGIKMARRSMRMQAARELGLSGRPSAAVVLQAIEARIAEIEAALKPGEVTSF